MKPLAKSLHTISVLVNLASYFTAQGVGREDALKTATIILKLDGKPDQYDLVAAAMKQLLAIPVGDRPAWDQPDHATAAPKETTQ